MPKLTPQEADSLADTLQVAMKRYERLKKTPVRGERYVSAELSVIHMMFDVFHEDACAEAYSNGASDAHMEL